VDGDPTRDIHEIEKVQIVFKEGVGFDPMRLLQSVRGMVGIE
jgi:hypothetical protein